MKTSEISSELRELADRIDSGPGQPLNFGEILTRLRQFANSGLGSHYLYFDWGCAWPTGFDSYRGDYSQICMEFGGKHRNSETVAGLVSKMEDLLGTDLTGWKGGEYTVDDCKDVYVCCAGNTSNTRIVGFKANGVGVTILTAEFEN